MTPGEISPATVERGLPRKQTRVAGTRSFSLNSWGRMEKHGKVAFAASVLPHDRMHLASVRRIDLHRMGCRSGGGVGGARDSAETTEGQRMIDDSNNPEI